MPNRFEQSAPPSIDKLYRGLPVGPFGVSPFVHPRRDRRDKNGVSITQSATWLLGLGKTVRSTLRRWLSGGEAYPTIALSERRPTCPTRP